MTSLRVGVIGGSIAGAAVGVLLSRQGHDVTVFERSGALLEDRGGGIGLPHGAIATFRDRDLIGTRMKGVVPRARPWCVKDGHSATGRLLHFGPTPWESHHWGLLYRELLDRVPSGRYRSNAEARIVAADDDGVTLLLDGEVHERFDLIVAADGYRSGIRERFFPDSARVDAGYIAWRGTLDESAVTDIAPIADLLQSPGTPHGHACFYLIPGHEGEVEVGRRRVNWLWYTADSVPAVKEVLGISESDPVPSVARGSLPAELVQYLRVQAAEQMPPWHAEVIANTPDPYIQPIYDVTSPRYVNGRICLVGDAASVARPHTGGGSTKAIQDALALADALNVEGSVDDALQRYDSERATAGAHMVKIGRKLGAAQVTDSPEWELFDPDSAERWFVENDLDPKPA